MGEGLLVGFDFSTARGINCAELRALGPRQLRRQTCLSQLLSGCCDEPLRTVDDIPEEHCPGHGADAARVG